MPYPSASLWGTPMIRQVSQFSQRKGKLLRINPMENNNVVRRKIFQPASADHLCSNFPKENHMETPIINIKEGKTRSVKVKPCQIACRRGAYTNSPVPGVFTIIIKAIVRPRKKSMERYRCMEKQEVWCMMYDVGISSLWFSIGSRK